MLRIFTFPGVWLGGYYELAIELSSKAAVHRMRTATAIWTHESLRGCFRSSDSEPKDQVIMRPQEIGDHCFGIATLPNAHDVACGTLTVSEEDGPDWLCFYIPMGSLATAYDVGGYPFGPVDNLHWRPVIDKWLISIAERAHGHVPFRLALLGYETAGAHRAEEILRTGVPCDSPLGFLLPDDGCLRYVPAAPHT